MTEKPHTQVLPDDTILKTITSIGRFHPQTFYPQRRQKQVQQIQTEQIAFTIDGMRLCQHKNAKLERRISMIEHDIKFLEGSIQRHKNYLKQFIEDHEEQTKLINQQIANRRTQIAKIDNAQEPPTMNQISALVRQIQVEGMAAKRRAENCLRDQDVNLVLSGDRLRKFHEFLSPKVTDTVLQENPKLRKSFDRMEKDVYQVAEIQTQLRSLKIYSTNLEKRLIELNSKYEALQFDKADIQMGIVDKKEELHAELTKRSEELGKLRWKIEYMKSLKKSMNEPHFDVRV
ncbi:hypothetical protein TRFO_14772 [Tritrichomonas foetus]|uniref:Uncharacterized protein n=1 Tax=Tritrichomonas foetus TaxID=1144522 RepID=A0A1J4KYP6_9EUKA|nr:hypothetical protein TRFO_14772 [Tritrichomonas foetus]|eukprot:OHT14828.1 hypothetical protein TRFO_14772 [Tritrichomonas foetus]